jgi:hypothetical protein
MAANDGVAGDVRDIRDDSPSVVVKLEGKAY